jgi:hypothetical protein
MVCCFRSFVGGVFRVVIGFAVDISSAIIGNLCFVMCLVIDEVTTCLDFGSLLNTSSPHLLQIAYSAVTYALRFKSGLSFTNLV